MNIIKLIFTMIDVILLISIIILDCGEISDSERKNYRVTFIVFLGNIISIWSK